VPAGDVEFDVRAADEADCVTNGGSRVCLRVIVSAVGQVRTCNTAVSNPHPDAC
jgi:hypothetical protein